MHLDSTSFRPNTDASGRVKYPVFHGLRDLRPQVLPLVTVALGRPDYVNPCTAPIMPLVKFKSSLKSKQKRRVSPSLHELNFVSLVLLAWSTLHFLYFCYCYRIPLLHFLCQCRPLKDEPSSHRFFSAILEFQPQTQCVGFIMWPGQVPQPSSPFSKLPDQVYRQRSSTSSHKSESSWSSTSPNEQINLNPRQRKLVRAQHLAYISDQLKRHSLADVCVIRAKPLSMRSMDQVQQLLWAHSKYRADRDSESRRITFGG